MFQSVDGHHLAFYMTEHNYSVFCNQKQSSTKNVNANLSGNLHPIDSLYTVESVKDIVPVIEHILGQNM